MEFTFFFLYFFDTENPKTLFILLLIETLIAGLILNRQRRAREAAFTILFNRRVVPSGFPREIIIEAAAPNVVLLPCRRARTRALFCLACSSRFWSSSRLIGPSLSITGCSRRGCELCGFASTISGRVTETRVTRVVMTSDCANTNSPGLIMAE